MTKDEFTKLVAELPMGKILPDAIYIHRSALKSKSKILYEAVSNAAKNAGIGSRHWNVAKLSKVEWRVSLLLLQQFLWRSVSTARQSFLIELATGKARTSDYGKGDQSANTSPKGATH